MPEACGILQEPESRAAVEVGERYADGLASEDERLAADAYAGG